MAEVLSCATGNFLTAGTWALVDSTSFNNSEAASATLTTTASANRSSGFTPGAITIDGIAVKLATRIGVTGTMTVRLWNNTDSANTPAGATCTINTADLPAGTAAGLDGGWIFFKFASSTLLTAAKSYMVEAFTSSASQVTLWSAATTNWSRMLRTTTTQAPVAGDNFHVAGEHTGAGTGNDLTVTMDQTAATDYGSAPTAANALILGCSVSKRGTFKFKDTSAANPYLRVSNSLIVYAGGTLNLGTTGTPIPRDSTAILEFDCAADGDYGLIIRSSSFTGQGLSRTAAKLIWKCLLNTDEAIGQTVHGVDADTGWLDNDWIAMASTSRTNTDCEVGQLNGAAGASSITTDNWVSLSNASDTVLAGPAGAGALTAAHSGTSPTQAEIILLTRNVKVRATNNTLPSYVTITSVASGPALAIDCDWVEFYGLGDNTGSRRGIQISIADSNSSSVNIQFCSLHSCEDMGLYITALSASTTLVFSSNAMWACGTGTGPSAQINVAVTGTGWTFDSNILIGNKNGNGWTLLDLGGTFTNNTITGVTSVGVLLAEIVTIANVSGTVSHSNGSHGMSTSGTGMNGTVASLTAWRNGGAGFNIGINTADFALTSPVMFGNTSRNILIASPLSMKITSPVMGGDTTFSTAANIDFTFNGPYNIEIDDGDLSTVSGIKTAATNDIALGNSTYPMDLRAVLRNTKFGAATEIGSPTFLANTGFIASEKHDQTAANHKTQMRNGVVQTDATTYNTAAPSILMTPNSASLKLESAPRFQGIKVPCTSGAAITPTVYIRKSATYNGNQPRLIVKANPAVGIASDTVLATYSGGTGSWASISGATASPTDDGMLEFVVDCDGTAGAINVDDWSFTGGAQDNGAMAYWFNGLPAPGVVPTAAGGGLLVNPGMRGGMAG